MHLQCSLQKWVALVGGAALVLAISAGAAAQQAKGAPAKEAKGTCQRCHAAGVPLPEKHVKITGASIADCVACHASQAGQAKPHPLASRLHRQHIKIGLDCTACHAYSPGKRFAVMGHEGNLGALDAEQYERVRKAMTTWASSPWLASIHGTKHNLSCGACHQKQLIPDDNETVINKQCAACHGDYDKLASATKAKLKNPNINPHGSHLGPEIACTVCHQGHQESKPYCLHCHTNFVMPIPGAAAKPTAPPAAKAATPAPGK
jgi:hypothetical protein